MRRGAAIATGARSSGSGGAMPALHRLHAPRGGVASTSNSSSSSHLTALSSSTTSSSIAAATPASRSAGPCSSSGRGSSVAARAASGAAAAGGAGGGDGAAAAAGGLGAFLAAFWKFLRPHTIRGTILGTTAVVARALLDNPNPIDWALLPRALLGLLALLCGNGYIVGINQVRCARLESGVCALLHSVCCLCR